MFKYKIIIIRRKKICIEYFIMVVCINMLDDIWWFGIINKIYQVENK